MEIILIFLSVFFFNQYYTLLELESQTILQIMMKSQHSRWIDRYNQTKSQTE